QEIRHCRISTGSPAPTINHVVTDVANRDDMNWKRQDIGASQPAKMIIDGARLPPRIRADCAVRHRPEPAMRCHQCERRALHAPAKRKYGQRLAHGFACASANDTSSLTFASAACAVLRIGPARSPTAFFCSALMATSRALSLRVMQTTPFGRRSLL